VITVPGTSRRVGRVSGLSSKLVQSRSEGHGNGRSENIVLQRTQGSD
jgi:hypothetical protein